MRKYIILIILLQSKVIWSQQEAQFTQYMDNMQYYNPAYAGSRGMLNMVGLHRQQWFGMSNAPMTSSFSFNTPLIYKSLGVGVSVLNDVVGPVRSNWINADLSYSLKFKKNKAKLSFGVKAGINLLNYDLAALTKQDITDEELTGVYENRLDPNVGFGIYYYSEKWFVGAASPKILETNLSNGLIHFQNQRHYYLCAGGYATLSRMLKLRPSTMLKITEGAPMALEVSLAVIFYDKLWLGANYRLEESVGLLFQYQLSKQFKFGYSFDFSTSIIRKHNAGTHELMLSYDLNLRKATISNPRYF